MTALSIHFFNIPGATMRVLNCFTRRGLAMEAVWCLPVGERHRATVLVEAAPLTIEQIIRELESTVGVDQVENLGEQTVEQLARTQVPAGVTA